MLKELSFFVITSILFVIFVKGTTSHFIPKTISPDIGIVVTAILFATVITILRKITGNTKDNFTFIIPPRRTGKTCPHGTHGRKQLPIPEYVQPAECNEQKPNSLSLNPVQQCKGVKHGRPIPAFGRLPDSDHEWKSSVNC
jgi:hypothetical protein